MAHLIPPKTFQALLAGLLQHVHVTEEPPHFLHKSKHRFKELHNVITNLYRQLQSHRHSDKVSGNPNEGRAEHTLGKGHSGDPLP